ncbi:uncharacterized protein [Mytilus edulis]|uniref:uncharacterized protein n=1 Tax=Mytilus edulis TaxID=6550 RepID=UPI0039EF0B52
MGHKKSFKDLITETTIDDIEENNATKYIHLLKDKIVINQFPLKIKIIITSEFTSPMTFGRIESHYSHPVEVVQTQNNLYTFYNNLIDKFEAWVDKFQERGSGFNFDGIKSVKVKLYKYEYQRASSYIPLQFKSSNIINVQNKKDNKCFLWSILASLFPANKDKQRVTKYKEYENEINMKGIEYPVSIKDIPKVEKQNNLSINVFALEDQTNKQYFHPVDISNVENFEAYNIPMQSCTPDPNKSYIKPISKQEINSYGLTWQCGLKYTEIKLELLTDVDMLQMFEKGIRGGFSGVLGPRHVKAFNKYTSNYDKDYRIIDEHEKKECLKRLKEEKNLNNFFEINYLLYLDANNLYGWAMSQKLPEEDFKWEKDPNYYKEIPKGRGCLIECDLKYTEKCKKKTYKYPLAPEKMKIKKEELSDYQLNLLGDKPLGNEEKLFLTLRDKKKYIIHDSILKKYRKLGIKVTKVYRTISFKESNWLAKYKNFNTEQRTKAKSDFEKDLGKLMNNSCYGKTLENIRGRSEIKLFTNREEVKKYIKKTNFKDSITFNDNFVAIENNVTSVKFNKPIHLGQAILDYSKQLMYSFYYDVANELWEKNELVASDTDSMILNIKTKDIYKDMEEIIDELDTSGYPKDHPLYSEKNKKSNW